MMSARNAVAAAFIVNGLLFASLVSRVPDLRRELSLSNGGLGLLLLAIAAGSMLALPSTGWLISRTSAGAVVRLGVVLSGVGLSVGALGAAVVSTVPVAAVGLFTYGIGTGVWDVAMNVEGAEVERGLGRSVMPRFHAGFSLGTILGAGVGVLVTALDVPMLLHLGVLGLAAMLVVLRWTRVFLPAVEHPEADMSRGTAWLEPRTLAVGLMILCFAVAEGSANDWLSLALIDGYDVEQWVGVAGYAVFVIAMTAGRVAGTSLLDRFGRAPVLWATAATAALGIVLVVVGDHVLLVGLGILAWGLGASLGFPVGMSAAADESARAAARVSVVSTIGYGAFLAGPPLLGWLGDEVGTLDSLLAVAALMGPALLAVFATRRPRPAAV
ncbi:MFS transporter [Nocardioides dilutus]